MSFGFLTESALLPSKSKPIKVDGRSLVDLKAVVYAKEQKVKLDGAGGSGSGGLRGLRGKRAAADVQSSGGGARKDPFARSNRGVEDRSQRDELDRVTASKKRKAAQRTMAAKSSLYEKMAKGEVGASQAGSLVDFARKTGADLALLEAKTSNKPKRRQISNKPPSIDRGHNSSSGKKRRRGSKRNGGASDDDDGEDDELDVDLYSVDDYDEDGGYSAEVNITDEYGRDRSLLRGGAEHRAYLESKKAVAEKKAEQKVEADAFDERYSYRGNRGSAPPPPNAPASERSGSPAAGASASGAAPSGGWAWSSGTGRGADAGDFETREGQERRAKKGMAELLEREGGGEAGKNDGGAKILSQWEKTLSGDQKKYLREVQDEAEASKTAMAQTGRGKQRSERKDLLRQKQAARAARLRGDHA